MRPVAGPASEAWDPMHRAAAIGTVEDEVAELALEVGLHPEETPRRSIFAWTVTGGAVEAGGHRLVDELIGLRGSVTAATARSKTFLSRRT